MTIKVKVTHDDMREGGRSCKNCPIQRAISKLCYGIVIVGYSGVDFIDPVNPRGLSTYSSLPHSARRWMEHWDHTDMEVNQYEEIEFEMDIHPSVLKQ